MNIYFNKMILKTQTAYTDKYETLLHCIIFHIKSATIEIIYFLRSTFLELFS